MIAQQFDDEISGTEVPDLFSFRKIIIGQQVFSVELFEDCRSEPLVPIGQRSYNRISSNSFLAEDYLGPAFRGLPIGATGSDRAGPVQSRQYLLAGGQ
jgi:hypothetical protein